MTVVELIEKLQQMDPNLPVYMRYWAIEGGEETGWDEIRDVSRLRTLSPRTQKANRNRMRFWKIPLYGKQHQWHRWFAWRPVIALNGTYGELTWLETVERRWDGTWSQKKWMYRVAQ